MTAERPKLRGLEATPFEHEGETWVCLRDPLGYSDRLVSAPLPLFFALSLMDGSNRLEEIASKFEQRFGQPFPRERLEEAVSQLDEVLFLDNERFAQHLAEQVASFRAAPTRPAAHAGSAYPEEEEACRSMLDGFFAHPDGPGPAVERPGRLAGLVAPHIDLRRGGVCSAHGYRRLADAGPPDTVVVFGTSHHPMRRRFGLTRKPYETPFGPVAVDNELVDRLEARLGNALFEDELNHRQEHSIEFQALFLGYLFPGGARPGMLPVLVGSLHDFVEASASPTEDPEFRAFLDALREEIAGLGRSVIHVAGVDLAHVGRRFGAGEAPSEADLRRIESADLASLESLRTLEREGFFRAICEEADARNVCGTAPITAMMQVMDADEGELLRYEQSYEDETGSVVTYASMAFYAGEGPGR